MSDGHGKNVQKSVHFDTLQEEKYLLNCRSLFVESIQGLHGSICTRIILKNVKTDSIKRSDVFYQLKLDLWISVENSSLDCVTH